jgi:hypothetical protein
MAEIAQRVLMNEFKQLSKEKWTNIEVSCGTIWCIVANRKPDACREQQSARQSL